MQRVTFEEYKNAIEIINKYKNQCNEDLKLVDIDNINYKKGNLKDVEIGQKITVVKNVKPSTSFIKGDSYLVLDKSNKGLQIRRKDNIPYWVTFANTFGRWGF